MSLLRSGVLNAIVVVIRIGTGLILNKILAVFVGPSGYALIGQFQNFASIATTFASGGIGVGVTKYTAEHFDDLDAQKGYWRSAVIISTAASVLLALVVLSFRAELAQYFLKDAGFSSVFVWFGCSLILLVWQSLLLAVLNGLKKLRQFVSINIIGSLVGLAFAAGLVTVRGLEGALIALVVSQVFVFFAAVLMCYREPWFRWQNFWGKFDPASAKRLSGFATMGIVTALAVPGSQIVIRNHLAAEFGLNAAGYWHAITKISDIYLLLITSTLSYYYLPRLSEIRSGSELKAEVVKAYTFLLPLAMLFAMLIYVCRDLIVRLLFSESFAPMAGLFFWQMVGDFLKIGSWLMSFLMIAKAMTRRYIATEVIFSLSLIGLTVLFTQKMGVEGAVFAFAVNYFCYWVLMFFICRDAFE